jgi:RNA polymerase sigma factor (sigma-70 family)
LGEHLGQAGFEHFYKENFSKVRLFVLSKCGDVDLADDLAQEAFIRLWHNADKVEAEKARSFALTVANNLFLDHVRHVKVIQNHQAIFVSQQDIKDPQYLYEVKEFEQKLNQTIASIPDGPREVFLLNRMEKMTYQQIADSLGLSVKAIEKRMQKALEIIAGLGIPKK